MQTAVPAVAAACEGATDLCLHRVDDAQSLSLLRDIARDLASDDSRMPRFPGPNPVSLDSTYFSKLAGEPYYVCEKTDGVRYLLVCCTMPAPPDLRSHRPLVNVCALLDRALNAYLFPLQQLPRAAYQGTLLDGEIAYNRAERRWEFLIFDAICVSGVPVLNGSLPDRLAAVHAVLRVYSPSEADPAVLRAKDFVPLSRLADFERAMDGGLRDAYDIDGVILTPAARPVVYGRHFGMFKLKFGAHHTVDFLVGQDGRSLSVFDSGTHVQVATLRPDAPPVPPGAIAECGLQQGTWVVVLLRTDKKTANDMYTYQKTLLNIREALTLDHLARVVPQRE